MGTDITCVCVHFRIIFFLPALKNFLEPSLLVPCFCSPGSISTYDFICKLCFVSLIILLVFSFDIQETIKFIEDLKQTIPNSEYHERKGIDIKKIVPQAIEKEFTDILVVNEDHKKASILFNTALIYIFHSNSFCL